MGHSSSRNRGRSLYSKFIKNCAVSASWQFASTWPDGQRRLSLYTAGLHRTGDCFGHSPSCNAVGSYRHRRRPLLIFAPRSSSENQRETAITGRTTTSSRIMSSGDCQRNTEIVRKTLRSAQASDVGPISRWRAFVCFTISLPSVAFPLSVVAIS